MLIVSIRSKGGKSQHFHTKTIQVTQAGVGVGRAILFIFDIRLTELKYELLCLIPK